MLFHKLEKKKYNFGSSLMALWLGFWAFTTTAWVQFLVWGTEILGVAHGDQKRKGTAWVGSRLSPTLPAGYLSAVYKLGSLRWQLVLMLP